MAYCFNIQILQFPHLHPPPAEAQLEPQPPSRIVTPPHIPHKKIVDLENEFRKTLKMVTCLMKTLWMFNNI